MTRPDLPGEPTATVSGQPVAVMLCPDLGSGRPPAASPAAAAAPSLVGVTTAAKIQHQLRPGARAEALTRPRRAITESGDLR
jgi:hypothetical protein